MATKLERLNWFIAATLNIDPSAVTGAQRERFGEGMYAVDAASWDALTNSEKLNVAVGKARQTFVSHIQQYETERDKAAVPPPAPLDEQP